MYQKRHAHLVIGMKRVNVEEKAWLTVTVKLLSGGEDGQNAIKNGPALNRTELGRRQDSGEKW